MLHYSYDKSWTQTTFRVFCWPILLRTKFVIEKLRKFYTRKNEQMKIVALNRLYVYKQHVYNRPNLSEKSEWVLGGGGGGGEGGCG